MLLLGIAPLLYSGMMVWGTFTQPQHLSLILYDYACQCVALTSICNMKTQFVSLILCSVQ